MLPIKISGDLTPIPPPTASSAAPDATKRRSFEESACTLFYPEVGEARQGDSQDILMIKGIVQDFLEDDQEIWERLSNSLETQNEALEQIAQMSCVITCITLNKLLEGRLVYSSLYLLLPNSM